MTDEYVMWKANQAEPWAESVRLAARHADSIRAETDMLRASIDGLKGIDYSRYGGGAHMEHGDDAMVNAIARYEQAVANLVVAKERWIDAEMDFSDCCNYLDGRYAQLLRLRYCCCMKWREVADQMGYSEQYVRDDLRVKALASLYDVMPHRFREPMHSAL